MHLSRVTGEDAETPFPSHASLPHATLRTSLPPHRKMTEHQRDQVTKRDETEPQTSPRTMSDVGSEARYPRRVEMSESESEFHSKSDGARNRFIRDKSKTSEMPK